MELRNKLLESSRARNVQEEVWQEAVDSLLLVLAPVAPHITEELWELRGHSYSIHDQPWPAWDEAVVKEETITLVVQVNGRVRDKLTVSAESNEESLESSALASEKIQKWLAGKPPRKVIVVKGKLVNIVV
jgi:leucyl-tRNA synthetase